MSRAHSVATGAEDAIDGRLLEHARLLDVAVAEQGHRLTGQTGDGVRHPADDEPDLVVGRGRAEFAQIERKVLRDHVYRRYSFSRVPRRVFSTSAGTTTGSSPAAIRSNRATSTGSPGPGIGSQVSHGSTSTSARSR